MNRSHPVKGTSMADGNKYVGYMKNGKKHGHGTYTYIKTKDKYVGDWKDDKKHGKGTFTWIAGNKYEGDWKDDMMHGTGTMIVKNSGKYEGEFRSGVPHGNGTYTYNDGESFDGVWQNDVIMARSYNDLSVMSSADCHDVVTLEKYENGAIIALYNPIENGKPKFDISQPIDNTNVCNFLIPEEYFFKNVTKDWKNPWFGSKMKEDEVRLYSLYIVDPPKSPVKSPKSKSKTQSLRLKSISKKNSTRRDQVNIITTR